MIEWGQKSKPKKSPIWLPTKPKKIPGLKINPPKFHAEFLSFKNLQKGKQVWLSLNRRTTRAPSWIKPPKKILAKFSSPKKSRNRKFQTPKNPLIIPVTWNPDYPPDPGINLPFPPLFASISPSYPLFFAISPFSLWLSFPLGFVPVMEILERHRINFKNFIFQAWKVMEFNSWSLKVMEN